MDRVGVSPRAVAAGGEVGFSDWGRLTDGESTPWAEWYDLKKLKRRLHPGKLSPILNFTFASEQFIWLDLIYSGMGLSRVDSRSRLTAQRRVRRQPMPETMPAHAATT